MKTSTIQITPEADVCGTSLQEYVVAQYKTLCALFGKPNDGDSDKVDAEWVLTTPFGVVTIYNYKDGKNYCGKDGTPKTKITDWHIGGSNKESALIVRTAVESYEAGFYSPKK
jgi:hypothetical protein